MRRLLKFDLDHKIQCSNWPIIPKSYRKYENINNYLASKEVDIYDKLKTEIKPKECPENCACYFFENLGSLNLEKGSWVSDCPNRAGTIFF